MQSPTYSALRVFTLLALCSINVITAHAQLGKLEDKRAVDTTSGESGDFYTFVTRPDIQAPKWNTTLYNESAVAPGYWFVAPYGQADSARVGPHIYDGTGELVWSGAYMFNGSRIFDFRVAKADGKDVITLIDVKEEAGLLLDDGYNAVEKVHLGESSAGTLNIHDFNIVDDGKHALFVKRLPAKANKEDSKAVGYGSECSVIFDGFEEWDITNPSSAPLFGWNSGAYVGLEESALSDASSMCSKGWDYFHANAIDKFPDGDYLLSGRFTGTIYKISAKDGTIVWRLGGKNSDFKLGKQVLFSAQGHARVQTQTETHTTISLIDNAILNSDTTNDQSRGLLLVLRTDRTPMTAEVVARYNHPHGEHAINQGDFQILPNGNAFLGWRDQALQSEHTPDGKVVLEANLLPQLYSYRNFKLPWVGHPKEPPDVRAESIKTESGEINTVVHVSWNGATEVAAWSLYKATKGGKKEVKLVQKAQRNGFETAFTYFGYVQHIIVEALDKDGKRIGLSKAVKVKNSSHSEAGEGKGDKHSGFRPEFLLTNPLMTLFFGCVFGGLGVIFLLTFRDCWHKRTPWWLKRPMYSRVSPRAASELELDELDERDHDK